jgi:hypothetical protein
MSSSPLPGAPLREAAQPSRNTPNAPQVQIVLLREADEFECVRSDTHWIAAHQFE